MVTPTHPELASSFYSPRCLGISPLLLYSRRLASPLHVNVFSYAVEFGLHFCSHLFGRVASWCPFLLFTHMYPTGGWRTDKGEDGLAGIRAILN